MSVAAIERPAASFSWIAAGVVLLWLFYLLLAPTAGFNWLDSWHNEQRAVQIVLLGITALALSTTAILHSHDITLPRMQVALSGAILIIGILSSLRASNPLAGLAEVSLFVLLLAVAFFAFQVTKARPEQVSRYARYFALLFCTGYTLGVLVRLFAAIQLGRGLDLDVLILGYANPRFASAFHAVLIPLVAGLVVDSGDRRWLRIIAFVVLVATWGINWGLGTRGIWFAYLIAFGALAILRRNAQLVAFAAVIAASAVLGILGFELLRYATSSLHPIAQAAVPPTSNLTLSSREILWELSWRSIKEAPLLGIGPMHFAALHSVVGAHPHNWILQVGAEWGLPALFVLCVLTVSILRLVVSRAGIEAATALLVALALGLVDGNLVMPVSQTAVASVAGLALGQSAFAVEWQGSSRTATRWLVPVIAVAATLTLVTFAYFSYQTQFAEQMEYLLANPGRWLVPRFWELGFL